MHMADDHTVPLMGVLGAFIFAAQMINFTIPGTGSSGHLSGGQKRSAALAGMLAMGPDLLLFDEPSSNLDPAGRRALITQLAALPQSKLVTTHEREHKAAGGCSPALPSLPAPPSLTP